MRRRIDVGSIVVVKIGSSSLSSGGSGLSDEAVSRVVGQVVDLRGAGYPTVLVTSGAVTAGMPPLGLSSRPSDLPGLQAAASVGQVRLMHRYEEAFSAMGVLVGQVLLTKAVLSERDQYLHARHALRRMLEMGVVPIVNENDTVAVEELRIGDNDRLAALVSHLVDARLLLLLTDTHGLFSRDPRSDSSAELLSAVRHTDELLDALAHGRPGPLGSGGVSTKIAAARMAAWSGVPTIIARAEEPNVVRRAVAGDDVGTWVEPQSDRLPARKLWIAFGQPAEGTVTVDAGAVTALVHSGRSLLPVGVTGVEGAFGMGAAVEVADPHGGIIAKGVSRMSADELRLAMGKPSSGRETIHRDDLVVLVPG